jgi:hypothetical protein
MVALNNGGSKQQWLMTQTQNVLIWIKNDKQKHSNLVNEKLLNINSWIYYNTNAFSILQSWTQPYIGEHWVIILMKELKLNIPVL